MTASTSAETFELSPEQLAFFRVHGYIGPLTVYSPESALGSSIMGAAPGTTVTYQAPNGRDISVEVVAVEPFVP